MLPFLKKILVYVFMSFVALRNVVCAIYEFFHVYTCTVCMYV